MYESNTYETILERMLSTLPSDIDKRQGSVAWDMLSPVALELAQSNVDKDNILTWCFASDKMPSEYLDKKVNEVGLIRKTDETDEALLSRYLEFVRNPSTSGNVANYIKWAKEVQGVGNATCIPIWNGPGTVKVVVTDDLGGVPNATVVNSVTSYIEANRPIGATVSVVGCTTTTINVTATMTLDSKYTLAQVQAQFIERLTDHFKSVSLNDSVVRLNTIGLILFGCDGVNDYTNLKLNSAASNVTLTQGAIPVLGTVTLS